MQLGPYPPPGHPKWDTEPTTNAPRDDPRQWSRVLLAFAAAVLALCAGVIIGSGANPNDIDINGREGQVYVVDQHRWITEAELRHEAGRS
jgi:hypothetical protein